MVTKEEINGYFLEAIRRLKAKGYTQKEIVEAAGLSQNAISKIKTGQNNAGDDTINKLCTAFKLNPDFFYRGSRQFTIADKMYHQSVPVIDSGSATNAAIAAYVELTNRLKQEMAERLEDKEAIIREKDARIIALERTIADRDARIIALERQIAAYHADDLSNYPFSVGVADKLVPKNNKKI